MLVQPGRAAADDRDDAPSAERLPLGACVRDDSCSFCVWAPQHERVRLRIEAPLQYVLELRTDTRGYHTAVVDGVTAGARYRYLLDDGSVLPDPASRHQPQGVHGPSEVVAAEFAWRTQTWAAPELRSMVLYELHVGTFTPEGTFDAAVALLEELRDIGVTAVELMPIAQFPGTRNWGYDGVCAFAAQNSYGGPAGLKRFVDAAHGLGLHVILDVVYNHMGPEGNYLRSFGPYFTDRYRTPWGDALNFDDAHSDDVRRYFIDSALQWIDEFRIDGLRLDAIHAIHDSSAEPFLRELTHAVHDRAAEHGRRVIVIAESDLGDPRVIRPARLGGLGMDAQWLDDFHHALRTLITHEAAGYYLDFGTMGHLARAYRQGYVYAGDFSLYRQRRHGAPAPDILPRQFVVYAQNHDQVGNRLLGDRLAAGQRSSQLRLTAAAVVLSPFTPMLFMGEEYGETRPFPYFVSHTDPELVAAVRRGRREEFDSFAWVGEPPDPQAEDTFRSAVLDPAARIMAEAHQMRAFYRRLLELRRTEPGIAGAATVGTEIVDRNGTPAADRTTEGVLVVRRRAAVQSSILALNFTDATVPLTLPVTAGVWRCALDTSAAAWGGSGSMIARSTTASGTLSLELHGFSAVLLLQDDAHPA